ALEILYKKIEKIGTNPDRSPEQKIIEYKDALYETYQSHPLMVRCIIHIQFERVMSNIQPETAWQIADINRKVSDIMLEVFKEGLSQGVFAPENPVVYLDICWGLFTGLILWEEAKKDLNPKKDFLKTTLDQSFNIFLTGIRSKQ
ncbi:MAG: hypothetical protein ACSHWQ_09135, partial [Spongiibacteraceae bacterium]